MLSKELLLIIIGFGALQSYLIGVYFLLKKTAFNKPSNLYLGMLFLAIGIRVSKSIYYLFLNGESIILYNIGFAAHAAIGPLLFLYFKSYKSRKMNKKDYFHLIPTAILFIATPFLTLDSFWYVGGYSLLLIYSLLYLTPHLALFFRSMDYLDKEEKRWFISLFIGVALFLAAYFTNYIMGWTSYELGPMLYGIIVYIISFFVLTNQDFFKKNKVEIESKYKNLNLTPDQCESYQQKIEKSIKDEKPYLNPDFNLSQLSETTMIPTHILSYVFNEAFGMKFTDYVNDQRILEAKIRLTDKKYAHLKIASIAHDSGFNSLSAFNAAFKKFSGNTPSQYRGQASTD